MQKSTIWLVTLIVIGLAACGGGTATTSQGSGAGTSSASNDTEVPAATMAPTTAGGASDASPSSGGGTAGGVCDLVTAEELEGIFGPDAVSGTVISGDSCIVNDPEGNPLVAWTYSTSDARLVYEALALPTQSVSVPGIGDQAAFVENTGLLVLKGDALFSVPAFVDQEIAKKIATIAAGRM